MQQAGAALTVFGRDNTKTIAVSEKFGALPATIEATSEIASHDIIINATSVGMKEQTEIELLPAHMLDADHIVFDLVYPRTTLLQQSAEQARATVIGGIEMLIHQAVEQIQLMTGQTIDANKLHQAIETAS